MVKDFLSLCCYHSEHGATPGFQAADFWAISFAPMVKKCLFSGQRLVT